ncbi:MAG: dicarboxylate/amino acid:cation symporter [Deltaproteobacteria bacterium]|nr:dicarboxylate/amino acid:cation symporter [Deltaproteobacteria bacterium]
MSDTQSESWYLKLHWQIGIAMLLAVPFGLLTGEAGAEAIGWLGDLFLRLLKMVVVPLIFFSIVSGVCSVGSLKRVGKLGARTVGYYLVSSTLAILVGLLLVNLIHPGEEGVLVQYRVGGSAGEEALLGEIESGSALRDLVFRLVPENPVEDMVYSGEDPRRGPNILGVIFFALLFGGCILALPDARRERLSSVFDMLFAVMMKMTGLVIRAAPLGVFALLGAVVGTTGLEAFRALGLYMLTVFGALAIHALVVLPLICALLARRNPWAYTRALAPALATAFSTASSNAALPVTMDCVERRAGISNRISSFVLPLGATVNMDGTALYECVAVLFLAQCHGVELGLAQQMVVVVTALLASVGAAGIPHAGLVMMGIVLTAVGLPLEGVGMILAVDRILDMCRTTINVFSDAVGTAFVARLEDGGEDGQTGG